MVDSDGVEGLEEFVHEISIFIDPESIPHELCRDRRSSFDHPSCSDIVNKTPSDPSVTDPTILPKISILEPYQSAQIEARDISKDRITVSDTPIGNDLPYFLIMYISDHERGRKWGQCEREKIRSIYENKEQYTSYDEKWDAGFFHEKEGITGTEDYSISKWY